MKTDPGSRAEDCAAMQHCGNQRRDARGAVLRCEFRDRVDAERRGVRVTCVAATGNWITSLTKNVWRMVPRSA
jgi:hypothetical protein